MWNIVALAYLFKVKVEVIYPAVNGSDNYSFIINNRTASFTHPNVGKGVFRILPGVYNTPTCDTTSFTQIRRSVRGVFGCYTDVWHNASNTPHKVMAISDKRPLCAIVGNCLYILNAFTHFLYLGGGLYVTIKKGCK